MTTATRTKLNARDIARGVAMSGYGGHNKCQLFQARFFCTYVDQLDAQITQWETDNKIVEWSRDDR